MKEIEKDLNLKIEKMKKVSKITNYIIIVLSIIFIAFFLSNFYSYNMDLKVFYIFAIIMCLIIGTIIVKNKTLKDIKNKIFINIFSDLISDYKIIYNSLGISKKEFQDSGLYSNYTDYYTSDGLKVLSNNLNIANVLALRKEENRKTTVFNGIFGYMQTEEFYEDEIIIKPDVENKYVKDILDEKSKLLGNSKYIVRLENSEFEKYFEVYSKNQIKARQLITPDYMEKIVAIRKTINAPIKIIYFGNKKYVALWDMRILNEKEIYKNGVNIEKIRENVEKIIDIFNKC